MFSDYFSAILGIVRQGSNWSLEPFGEMRDKDHQLFERGRGNACSVEVRDLYIVVLVIILDNGLVQLFVQVARNYFSRR